jgi:phosphatidylserine/phosphatidylglycerophosphate/cardiolipin synthase-like enzyme
LITPLVEISRHHLSHAPVLVPGLNCMRLARASHAALLVDACDYFSRLADTLAQAERSILIIGWDFDGRIKLCPDQDQCPALGPFLRSLAEAKPELQIHILVWSLAVVHAPGAPLPLLVGQPWQDHPRINVRLDREHPVYAAHHQKIVCIDDSLAFVGGIDLTVRRWDTCGHDETLAFRTHPDGTTYDPVHDVQMIIAGDAARVLADVARDRWRCATQDASLKSQLPRRELWPSSLEADFTDVPIGIARTAPAWRGNEAIGEIAQLTIDMLSAAESTIYLEAQYLTARLVRRWMEKSLASRHGPEIVVVLKRTLPGVLERLVMGGNRDRTLRRLRRADRHNRLRAFYPVVSGRTGACEVLMHSKVLIIDDRIIRVGSSNLNNRSMGLDTECDIVIDAQGDHHRHVISSLRDRLLAEHLDVAPDAVSAAIRSEQSLIRAIDRLNRGARGLRPFPERRFGGPLHSIAGTWLLDPPRPIEPLWWRLRAREEPDVSS